MGQMGMSLDDFDRLTPAEFEAVSLAWAEHRDAQTRDDWERMRTLATVIVQPYSKKRLTPQKLLPLAWDKTQHEAEKGAAADSPELTARRMAQFGKE